jgi:hypothetical protein
MNKDYILDRVSSYIVVRLKVSPEKLRYPKPEKIEMLQEYEAESLVNAHDNSELVIKDSTGKIAAIVKLLNKNGSSCNIGIKINDGYSVFRMNNASQEDRQAALNLHKQRKEKPCAKTGICHQE